MIVTNMITNTWETKSMDYEEGDGLVTHSRCWEEIYDITDQTNNIA